MDSQHRTIFTTWDW